MTTITELMTETLPQAFIPEKAVGIDSIIQFRFTGSEVSEWYVVIKDGKCDVTKGVHAESKMTMTVDADSYIKISTGELDATVAFMKGKVKVNGDMSIALKMGQFFKYGK